MAYFVKNKSGAEFEVTKQVYDQCVNVDDYECREDSNARHTIIPEVFAKTEPTKAQPTETNVMEYPKKDPTGSWYTLSNGKRYQGQKAFAEQVKLNKVAK